MLVIPPIQRYADFIGITSALRTRLSLRASKIGQSLDRNTFLDILRKIENTISETHETWEARKIIQSLIARKLVIHFSELDDYAIKIIRANLSQDEELMQMMEQVIPHFKKHFLKLMSEESSDNS
jgi:hypothetical protein